MLTLKAWKDYKGVILENEHGRTFRIYKGKSNCPDYRYKYYMINCFRYKLQWIK